MAESARAAAAFGEITLPPAIEILAADSDSGRDSRHRLALRMNEAQLDDLLGQFSTAPRPSDIPKSTAVIAGPALSSAPNPLYTQDKIATPDHGTVTREVIVDERAPDDVYVHLSLYTT